MMNTTLNIGVQGMQSNMQRLDRAASDIARVNVPDAQVSLEKSMVTQIEATHLVKANARTIEAASDTLGTLLDIRV